MSKVYISPSYQPALGLYETQTAIGILKREFETRLAASLNLKRVSAPLFVDPLTGLNDNLNGTERAVRCRGSALACKMEAHGASQLRI